MRSSFAQVKFCGILPVVGLLCGSLLIPASVRAQPSATGVETSAQNAAWDAMNKKVDALKDANPQEALAEAQKFRQAFAGDQLSTRHLLWWSIIVSDLTYNRLKKPEVALAALDEVLSRPPYNHEWFLAPARKAEILLGEKRPQEAEAVLQGQWLQAKRDDGMQSARTLLSPYVSALEAQNKASEARRLRLETVYNYPRHFGESLWLSEQLVDALIAAGEETEAVGWAKLHYQACPFDEKAMTDSTQLLARAWTASELTPAKAQAFIKAQTEEGAPNPLREVKRPSVDVEAVQARLAQNTKASKERVTLMLMLGNLRGAMLEARRVLLEFPESSEGVSEICRVFKAADLNVKRANAFLVFYKDGQGPNPVNQFLQENKDKPE